MQRILQQPPQPLFAYVLPLDRQRQQGIHLRWDTFEVGYAVHTLHCYSSPAAPTEHERGGDIAPTNRLSRRGRRSHRQVH